MSFILDALKKSESERQRQAGPALLEMRIVRPSRRLPVWAVVVGVLLIISVGVLAWLALRPSTAPATAPAAVAGTAAPASAAQTPAGAPAAAPAQAPATVAAAPVPAAPTVQAPAQASAPPADSNPADTEPAVAPPASAARESAETANLRNYAELGGSLPELRLDLHVYATNPAERYAFINMHKVREGDVTPEGMQVKEITREGVVLEYRGTEFLLGHQ